GTPKLAQFPFLKKGSDWRYRSRLRQWRSHNSIASLCSLTLPREVLTSDIAVVNLMAQAADGSRSSRVRAGRVVAVVERGRALADQRLVDEVRTAALVELGLGGGDQGGVGKELRAGEREGLRRDHHRFGADAGAAGRDRLPAVRGRSRHPGRRIE